MADSDAVKKLGEAARSGFKSKKDPFAGAREGALKAMSPDREQAPAREDLFAQKAAPAPGPSAMPSPAAPMAEEDQLQALSDEQMRLTGRPMSLDEAKAALQRRQQKSAPQVYPSLER